MYSRPEASALYKNMTGVIFIFMLHLLCSCARVGTVSKMLQSTHAEEDSRKQTCGQNGWDVCEGAPMFGNSCIVAGLSLL